MIEPIYKKIEAMGSYSQSVMALTTACTTFNEGQIPYFSYQHLPENTYEAQQIGRTLLQEQYQHPDVPLEESIAYLGVNYLELIQMYGKNEACRVFASEGRHAFYPKETFKKILLRETPDLVIATNSPRSEKAVFDAARDLSIQSLCVVDLFTRSELQGFLSQPGYSTKICVINELAKSIITNAGRPSEEVIVTGNPAFDSLAKKESFISGRSYKEAKKLRGPVILWARSAIAKDIQIADEFEESLIKFATANKEYTVILRPHPNEFPRSYPSLPNLIVSTKEESIVAVLHASDIVVTLYSTVAVEAHLIGKKVIQIMCTEMSKSFDCVSAGIATGVNDISDFSNVIKRVAGNISLDENKIPLLNAADKISGIVVKLLEKSK